MKGDLKKRDERPKKNYKVSRAQLRRLLVRLEDQLFSGKLAIGGEKVSIPRDAEIEVRIKYEHDGRNELTIKIEWKTDNLGGEHDCEYEYDRHTGHEDEDD